MSLQALQQSPAVPSPAVPSCIEAGAGPDTALFLHGLGDFDREADLARMAEAIPGARYRCLADAGHVANMENPAAFNAEIGRFLQAISRQEADRY